MHVSREGARTMYGPFDARHYALPDNRVSFETDDAALERLYRKAESACGVNRCVLNGKPFLREGGGYGNLWLETQPMGGAMYAARDPETGLNNILAFMQYQRRDGRMPGMIFQTDGQGLCAAYDWFQGFCFPGPALDMYWMIGEDREYLSMLFHALKDFDDYLWRFRSGENGCLYRWCCWDTGEDNLSLLLENGGRDGCFGGEFPPECTGRSMPWTSMEMMGWSCACRDTMAAILDILGMGEAQTWRKAAGDVRSVLERNLWDEARGACFEKDSNGRRLDCLSHVNLRCMYYGVFSQHMAETFVRRHLMNPEEFCTPVPLPSIAVNDPWFRDIPENNWSGPSQGLTWQRCIRALQNYSFHRELAGLGMAWVNHLKTAEKLTQQYSPVSGRPGTGPDLYGPTCLSALEFIALLYGVHIEGRYMACCSAPDGSTSVFSQKLGEDLWQAVRSREGLTVLRNQKVLVQVPHGVRLVMDRTGRELERMHVMR